MSFSTRSPIAISERFTFIELVEGTPKIITSTDAEVLKTRFRALNPCPAPTVVPPTDFTAAYAKLYAAADLAIDSTVNDRVYVDANTPVENGAHTTISYPTPVVISVTPLFGFTFILASCAEHLSIYNATLRTTTVLRAEDPEPTVIPSIISHRYYRCMCLRSGVISVSQITTTSTSQVVAFGVGVSAGMYTTLNGFASGSMSPNGSMVTNTLALLKDTDGEYVQAGIAAVANTSKLVIGFVAGLDDDVYNLVPPPL